MSAASRKPTLMVAICVAVLSSACGTTAAQPSAAGGPTPQAMPSGLVDLHAGTYAIRYALLDLPGKPFPRVVLTVPDGWTSNDGLAVIRHLDDRPRLMAVAFWGVVDVYTNGCHWLGPLIHPGPTVDELAAVLASRPLRNATTPVAVTFGGYHGEYMEWSVPADLKLSDCDRGPGDTDGVFESWTGYGTGGTDRYEFPGQLDRLWILDVEGRRLVVDAYYMPGSTEQDRAELQQVVNSISFKP